MTSIVQISDTHICTREPAAARRLADLAHTVDAINALTPRPAAVLHTGDVAHNGTAADYAAARAVLSRLAMPIYAVPGNRDRRDPFRDAFAAPQGPVASSRFVQLAVEIGPLRAIGVDTCDEASGLGAWCAAREESLRTLLDAEPDRPTLVFLHHPPVAIRAVRHQPVQFRDAQHAQRLLGCLESRANIVGIIAGHVHRSDTIELARTTLSTMPSIAVDLRRESLPEPHAGQPVLRLHRFDGRQLTSASVVVRDGGSR